MNGRFQSYDEKEAFVQEVFSKIAKRYDLMNTVLSFGQDSYWRKRAIRELQLQPGMHIIDVACGTGMLTKTAVDAEPTLRVEGLDFNAAMLEEGAKRLKKYGIADRVHLTQGDAMAMPYEDNTFDGAVSGFAMRNVPDVRSVLREMKRVVKPGGHVVTVELGKPTVVGFKQLYYFYFEKIVPWMGKFNKSRSSYSWLPESLQAYPHQRIILDWYREVGLEHTACYELTGGIACVHVGTVPVEK